MASQRISIDDLTQGLGAFDDLEFIDAGTFGDTFRVVRGDDEFALKVIMIEDLPDYLWERELEALSRVDHPNIVNLEDAGTFEVDGREYPYAFFEFIVGGSLKEAIAHGQTADDPAMARGLLTGLLSGVGEIHDLGILHRDIKPANICLRDGHFDQPVLLDFGLARVLDMSTHTKLPARIGTTGYMSPEQLQGRAARRRSDLFSVGVVTYEAISGQHPFLDNSISGVQSLHDRIESGPIADLGDLAPSCPDEVRAVVMRLLRYWGHDRLGISAALADLREGH